MCQCQSARDRASSTDSARSRPRATHANGSGSQETTVNEQAEETKTDAVLDACLLVNPITKWKTTKQNGIMIKARQNQRMSNRQGSRGPPSTQKLSPSSNSISSSAQRASVGRKPNFTDRLSSFASSSLDVPTSRRGDPSSDRLRSGHKKLRQRESHGSRRLQKHLHPLRLEPKSPRTTPVKVHP